MYTLTLWKLEQDVVQAPVASRMALVAAALKAVDRWKDAAASRGGDGDDGFLVPSDEFDYYRLSYLAANTAEEMGELQLAMGLYQRVLVGDLVTANHDQEILDLMRGWQIQSLQNWSMCVVRLGLKDAVPQLEALVIAAVRGDAD